MKNLLVRSLSGIVYVGLIVGAILAGEEWFFLLTALFGVLGVMELQTIAKVKFQGILPVCLLLLDIAAVIVLAWLPVGGMLEMMIFTAPLLMLYFILRGVGALYDKREHPFRNAAWSALSVVYIGLAMLALNNLYGFEAPHSKWLVLTMFVLIWLNDTGAYCFGTMLGRHKMFPRLSPKKSWEGFFGGLLCVMVASWCAFKWFNTMELEMWKWLLVGFVTCVFATWGDLFESLLKRNAGVKDSGNIIPGHGGILDRIDSLLFVAPALTVLIFVMP